MTQIGVNLAHGPVAPLAQMCDNVPHNLMGGVASHPGLLHSIQKEY